jgi:hypothetical protein
MYVPTPNKDYYQWFEMEFGVPLGDYWTQSGPDLDKFIADVGLSGVSDDDLLPAIINKFGYRAARLIARLELMVIQAQSAPD